MPLNAQANAWDELHLAENPAVELLQSLGYTYMAPEDVDPRAPEPQGTHPHQPPRRRPQAPETPWLSDTDVTRAVKAVTQVPTASLAEANETLYTSLTKLDRQIAGVFTACGFPNPERANSVRDLRRILAHPTGKTVMTTIQKFQEITGAGSGARRGAVHPTLSEAANIFVMVDEAHRTQYRSLAANMRQALPNACFLGFTGTPIDK